MANFGEKKIRKNYRTKHFFLRKCSIFRDVNSKKKKSRESKTLVSKIEEKMFEFKWTLPYK
jgi:hypothetical protein